MRGLTYVAVFVHGDTLTFPDVTRSEEGEGTTTLHKSSGEYVTLFHRNLLYLRLHGRSR